MTQHSDRLGKRCPICGGRGLPENHPHVGGPFPSMEAEPITRSTPSVEEAESVWERLAAEHHVSVQEVIQDAIDKMDVPYDIHGALQWFAEQVRTSTITEIEDMLLSNLDENAHVNLEMIRHIIGEVRRRGA